MADQQIIIPNEKEKIRLGVATDDYYLRPAIQEIIQEYVKQEKIFCNKNAY